jgi:hypothetical protein
LKTGLKYSASGGAEKMDIACRFKKLLAARVLKMRREASAYSDDGVDQISQIHSGQTAAILDMSGVAKKSEEHQVNSPAVMH